MTLNTVISIILIYFISFVSYIKFSFDLAEKETENSGWDHKNAPQFTRH